jgi:cell division septation protein DedD
MTFPKIKSFIANASEQKYSVIIATVATVAVASTVVWTSFFSVDNTTGTAATSLQQPAAIKVTEKPLIKTSAKHSYQPAAQPVNTAPKAPKQARLEQTKKSVPKKQVVIGQGNLYVQIGAFKQSKGAHLSLKKMQKKYKRAKIVTKSNLHLVWVGPVVTRQEAERLQKHIQQRDNIKGFITSAH